MLLHGWTATADLNFFTCYEPLGEHYRVVAIDHRGHGRGHPQPASRSGSRTAPTTSAGDGRRARHRPLHPVGYSMGGPIAQLLWRRHPDACAGSCSCATASHFSAGRDERLTFLGLTGLAALARLTPAQARAG